MKSTTNRLLLSGLAVSAIACLGLSWRGGSALMCPRRHRVGNLPKDLDGQAVQFLSPSGATLKGWFIPGQRTDATVILMHGVRGTRSDMLGRARFLNRAGYAAMLFDFQAHGESTGERITFGHAESQDARAAVEYVRLKNPQGKIAIVGGSLGGAAAVLADPKLDVNAMVLEMVYATIQQATQNRLQAYFGGISKALTPLLTCQLKLRLGVSPNRLRPIDRVPVISAAKLFIAGAQDIYTPLKESIALFQAAAPPKEFWAVEGAGHIDFYRHAKLDYEDKVLSFLKKHLN